VNRLLTKQLARLKLSPLVPSPPVASAPDVASPASADRPGFVPGTQSPHPCWRVSEVPPGYHSWDLGREGRFARQTRDAGGCPEPLDSTCGCGESRRSGTCQGFPRSPSPTEAPLGGTRREEAGWQASEARQGCYSRFGRPSRVVDVMLLETARLRLPFQAGQVMYTVDSTEVSPCIRDT